MSNKNSVLILAIFISLSLIANASIFQNLNESDFNLGTYFQISWNSSDNFIGLSGTNLSGNFTSQIFDANTSISWNNISWFTKTPYGLQLPSNQEIETGDFIRGMNMTGNTLLLHFNNNSDYGENDSLIYDFSGNGNNGTWGGDATPDADSGYSSSGKLGGSFKFDGVDDYIDLGPSTGNYTDNFTIAGWIKTSQIGGRVLASRRYSSGTQYDIYTKGSGELGLYDGSSTYSGTKSVSDNVWHHVSVVINGSNSQFYVDGLVDGSSFNPSISSKVVNTYVGAWAINPGTPQGDYNGSMDELAMWNRTLSSQEIQDLYKRGALRLNLSVQNCSLSNCAGETWQNIGLTSPQNLNLSSQYFRYKFEFETDSESFTPQIFNVTLDYTPEPATVVLISPSSGSSLEGQQQTFTCNASSTSGPTLLNISLYHNATGTWTLNQTNSITGATNESSFTVSGLDFTTFYWNCEVQDSNGLSSFASSNFTFTTLADSANPSVNSHSITPSLTSGDQATLRVNTTDSSPISSVIIQLTSPSNSKTNYTLSQEGSTDFYNTSFESEIAGNWSYQIYVNDSYNNINNSITANFTISLPATSPQNETYPTTALPSSSIIISTSLLATDSLNLVNATLNTPSNFEFPFTNYNQTQEIGNFSSSQTKTAYWIIYLPSQETTHTLNVTWTDKYGNEFQGANFEFTTSYDITNFSNSTNVNTIIFPELEAGAVLESEIQVRDINGNFINATSVEISLYDPNDNLIVDSVTYTSQLGFGRYFYNYTTPVSPTGQWQIKVNVTRNGNSFIDREYFRVTGGPFDIREITITDSSIPSLAISTILENVGDGVTDIVVDWNLTRTDTGALLDSGQDTIGVTSEVMHTISPSTTYIGNVKITFLGTWSLTERAGAFKTFTTISTPTSSSSSSSGSSGGSFSSTPQETIIESSQIICNTPYMRHETRCCLDTNRNNICDPDEIKASENKLLAKENPSVEKIISENKLKVTLNYIRNNFNLTLKNSGLLIILVILILIKVILSKVKPKKFKEDDYNFSRYLNS